MFQSPSWKTCILCPNVKFYGIKDFTFHLREAHCKKEGGSFTCHYGKNNLCQFIPLEGVSDRDYEQHVLKIHLKIPIDIMSDDLDLAPAPQMPEEGPSQPSVVSDPQKWTYYHACVNMPALLNDPAKGKQLDIFTQHWGTEFQKSHVSPSKKIPDVSSKAFRQYLKKTASRLKYHIQQAEECPVTAPAPSVEQKRAYQLKEELQAVPSFFYRSAFDLSDRDLFFQVYPPERISFAFGPSGENSDAPGSSSYALMNNLRTYHDKLSHQLDIVEMHISSHISKQSSTFFNAMTSHGDIQSDIQRTAVAVGATRSKLSNAKETAISKNLAVLPLVRRRQRNCDIYTKLKIMATVQQTQPTIQLLLSNSDFIGALELIQYTQDILAKDLVGIKAFRHLAPQLDEIKKVIDAMVDKEIMDFFHEDLARPLVPEEAFVSNPHILSQLVQALLHLKKYSFLDLYRKECLTIVAPLFKNVVISNVSQCDSIDVDTRNTSISDQMRLLDFNHWMNLFNEILSKMSLLLKRVHSTLSLVLEEDRRRIREAENEASAKVDSQELQKNVRQTLTNFCDQTHDRCKKLLLARSKDGFFERLSMSEFVRFTQAVEEFASGTECLMDRKGVSALRSALAACSIKFVSKFHEDQKGKLVLLLESERWKPADVPAEFQKLAHHISESGFFDTATSVSNQMGSEVETSLVFKGKQYLLVSTVLMLLKMTSAYCQLVENVPSLAPDISIKVIDILRLFNAKSSQLVLGAGAIEIVKLKSISSKNLALCATCLKFILAFLPSLKLFFEKYLGFSQNSFHYDINNVLKDYQKHADEIITKLYDILVKTVDNHLTKCLADLRPPAPSATMKSLVNQMTTFHGSIHSTLPTDVCLSIFTKCNEFVASKVSESLQTRSIKLDSNSTHILLLTELKFYSDSINKLPGLEGLSLKKDFVNL